MFQLSGFCCKKALNSYFDSHPILTVNAPRLGQQDVQHARADFLVGLVWVFGLLSEAEAESRVEPGKVAYQKPGLNPT